MNSATSPSESSFKYTKNGSQTNLKSFLIHVDSIQILDKLTDEESGMLFKAIKGFLEGDEYPLNDKLDLVFFPFKNQLIRDLDKYRAKCEKNRINGAKGGKQRQANASERYHLETTSSETKQPQANQAYNKNKKNNKNNNKFQFLLECLNEHAQKNHKVISKEVELQISKRLMDGYTLDDIAVAIENASKDTWHRENEYRYLTLEFITRPDKLEKFTSINPDGFKLSAKQMNNLHNKGL